MIDPKKKESKLDFDDIKDFLNQGESFWESIHREYTEANTFSRSTGLEQWDAPTLAGRGGRPADTYNIVNGFINPVINLVKQNPPAVAVYPIADGASKTNAKLISGIIRAIEYSCGAQREYCSALENAARGGYGVIKITPRLSDVGDDDVDFVISNIQDPTKVFIDPSAKKADYSDAQWVIIKNTMSDRQYKRDYPDGKAEGLNGVVDINELWVKEFKNVNEFDPKTGYTVRKRKVRILQYIFDAHEILEVISDYPGKYLPFAVVTGPRYVSDEVTHFHSITNILKGVQKEINFLKSEQIATIACSPKATFYGDNNAFQSAEEQEAWEESATNPRVFLGHKPGANINQFNMPQIPTVYIETVKENIDLARVMTGIYPDPSLQNGLNAVSGKAIKQQQAGQAVATFEYVDSLNYAIKHVGEILLDLLPSYWNDNRIRLSMGVDGKYSSVSMGDENVEGADNFDLAYGRYAVSISTGPSYASQKEALIEMIMDTIKTNPQAMSIALPWIINQINLPGSEELSDMFSLLLPPEIQQFMSQMKSESSDPQEQLKGAMIQLQKLSQDNQQKKQMIDQLTAALENETAQLKSKEQELEAKKQIEAEKSQANIILEAIKHQNNIELAEMKAKFAEMSKYFDGESSERMKKLEVASQIAMKELDHQNDMEKISHQGATDTLKTVISSQATPKKDKKD